MIDNKLISLLPAFRIADEVNAGLHTHTRMVITAPPGAGKSTLLPLTIMQSVPGKVLILEPRRLPARIIAERMAEILGERVGETVGYRIRFESRVSERTRVEVLTEGILTRMLIDDPMLEGVSVVIFDEFHERSLVADQALALTLDVQNVLCPDLRVVVMSATIEVDMLCQKLDAVLVECQGRMFPVDTVYVPRDDDSTTVESVARDMARLILKAHAEQEGDILAFLPGQAEILRCKDLLGESLGRTHIFPLYGMLSSEQQIQAVRPSREGERKVVLATNIAETSLTIEGVRIVVDSGLQRKMVYDARTELSHLRTVPVSLDMATQRRGRAGRVCEGMCYRMWSPAFEHSLAANRKPEILEADLAPLLLNVAVWGETAPMRMPWVTPPPQDAIFKAASLLRLLGAIDENGKITDLGKKISEFPCHPRLARMLLSDSTPQDRALAADIAALLEERDPLAYGSSASGAAAQIDINLRIEMLRRHRAGHRGRGAMERLLRVSEEYRKRVHVAEDNSFVVPEQTGALLCLAFPERVAHALDSAGHYRLASGANVCIDASDPMSSYSWIVAAQLNASSGRVFLASPVREADLKALSTPVDRVAWVNKTGTLVCQREWRIGQLVLETKPLQATRQQMLDTLCQAAGDYGESMFDFSCDVLQLQLRVDFVRRCHPELNLLDLSSEYILTHSHDWLPFYADNNGRLRTDVAELKRIDMVAASWSLLSYEQQLSVDRYAPTHITVPTGSRIRLDYRPGAEAPVLSVRLQECFGLVDTPCVDDGRVPVLMELLSPGFKPVQLTRDLKSFWTGTYFEVRKELRCRYPKHFWPDNPLESDPTRGVKKRT